MGVAGGAGFDHAFVIYGRNCPCYGGAVNEIGMGRLVWEIGTVDDDDMIQKQFPGFKVSCRSCGSERVVLENSMGFSAESGGWGELELVCQECGARCTLCEM